MGLTPLLLLLLAPIASAADCPVTRWDAAAPYDGTLAAGDCRVTDLIPARSETNVARQVAIEITAKGLYTFELASTEFDTILLVTDARFQTIGLNDDTSRNDSRLVAHLTPETYYVFVVSNRGTGAFNLRVSFQEQSGCAIRELDGGGAVVNSQLGSGSCRLLDVLAPSALTLTGDIYHFQIDQPRVLTAAMQSRAVDPLLALVEARTGRLVASDDDSLDGFNALLLQSVEPGEYYLVATLSRGTSGAYAVQTRLEAPRNCETRDLRAGDSASGQLAEADCRVLDVSAGSDDESRLDLYRIELTDPGVLTIETNSGAFPPASFLFSSEGKLLASALSARTNQAARLAISLKAGRYLIGASHSQLSAGAYQLRTTFETLRNCEPEPLPPDTTAAGSLSTSGCRYLDVLAPETSTAAVKPYRLTLEKRSQVTIDMTSPQIDSALVVLDAAGKAFAQDDNSGGGSNARLSLLLNPGSYTLLAASAQSGSFEIRAAAADPRSCPAGELNFTDTARGDLTDQDCALREVIAEDGRAVPAEFYPLTLTEPGTLTLDLYSASFLPTLILTDASGRALATDDPGTRSLGAAHILRSLPAGTYGVAVTASGGRAGAYALRAGFRK